MPRRRFTPSFHPLEERLALSTLTTPAYLGAKAAVSHALIGLSRTGDLQRATAVITRAAASIPLSGPVLLPLWESELATVSRGKAGSALQARRDMYLELDVHLHRGVEAGAITVRGPGSRQISRPAVQALDGYTYFYNKSSYMLIFSISQSDRLIDQQVVASGQTLHIKPPVGVDGTLSPSGDFTVAISKNQQDWHKGIEVADLADKVFIATDSRIPGEIDVRFTNENVYPPVTCDHVLPGRH